MPSILEKKIPGFSKQAAFVSGNSKEVEKIAKRFSPVSKKYKLKKGEHELNYLFATDVLSEGQNLQDAGILVNYDLHWNPVRMIQRNGRINRLGSTYDEVLIANARPSDDLEAYLKLVRRLERKIDTINSTVGNDQSILGEEANPIEFNDMLDYFDNNSEIASKAAEKLQLQNDPLDIYSSLLTLIVSILVLLLSGVVFIIFKASCSSTYSALIELNGPLFLPDELIFVKPTSLIFSPVLVTFLLVE